MVESRFDKILSDKSLRGNAEQQKKIFDRVPAKKIQFFLALFLIVLVLFSKVYNEKYWSLFYEENYTEISQSHISTNLSLAIDSTSTFRASVLRPNDVEKINLNIKFDDWQAIKARRNELLDVWHNVSDDLERKITMDWRGKKLKAKIRLKGIGFDHRTDPKKWSFAIKLRGDKYIMGMSEFAIQDPKTRKYWSECSFLKSLEINGVIAPYCDHVEVFINGERIGIMTLVERMTTEMLERQGRKEGVIAKPDYADIWDNLNKTSYFIRDHPNAIAPQNLSSNFRAGMEKVTLNRLVFPLEFYSKKSIRKNEFLKAQRKNAAQLFEAMLNSEIPPSEAFDVQITGSALATTFFWGDYHAFQIHNLKLYFNPITFKFEPIPTDVGAVGNDHVNSPSFQNGVKGTRDLFYILTTDPKIRASFSSKVRQYAKGFESGDIFGSEFQSFNTEQLLKLKKDYKMLPRLSIGAFKRRYENHIDRINKDSFFQPTPEMRTPKVLELPKEFNVQRPVVVNLIRQPERSYIRLRNSLPQPTILKELLITVNGNPRVFEHNLPSIIPGTTPGFDPITGMKVGEIAIPIFNIKPTDVVEITAMVSPELQDRDYRVVAKLGYSQVKENPVTPTDKVEILEGNPFLILSADMKNFIVKPGIWSVDKFIKIPNGMGLIIGQGTVLKFEKEAGFLIRGSINIVGTAQSPVILKASTPDDGWAGITVMNANLYEAGVDSILEHVKIFDTNSAHYLSWNITGAINFYKSDVDLNNVTISRTSAEDALNIIHSTFKMDRVEISHTRSDGFDGDFTSGIIKNSKFSTIGGDAIDFSGSKIDVQNSEFFNVEDKAVSAGEATQLKANHLMIKNSGTGIVSKDGSNVIVLNSEFENMKYSSLMAYIKKAQYGGASLEANGNKIPLQEIAIIVQRKSRMVINGRIIPARKINIEKLYKDGYMKK